MTATTTTTATLTAFLDVLFASLQGYVEVRALPSKARTFCEPGQWQAVDRFAHEHADENVYVGVALRRNMQNGRLENCSYLPALYVDLDFKDIAELDARRRLANCPILPSIIVASGGGLHPYWLLKEPEDLATGLEQVEATLRALAAYLGADVKCAEAARVLRLPDSLNTKYTPARRVTVEALDAERRYTLGDFDWLPAAPRAVTKEGTFTVEGEISEGGRNDTLYRLARALKAKGLPAATLASALHTVNDRQCKPPLSAREVAGIAEHASGQGNRPDFDQATEDRGATDEQRITTELARERARREARRRLDAEERGTAREPEIVTLQERLARPRQALLSRIDCWQPRDARVIVSAQFKAGKTVLVGNLIRSLVDGDPFLGRDRVTPIAGRVALLDFEMSTTQLDDWLRAQGIRHADRVLVIPMRGQAGAFNILEPATRAAWAGRFSDHQVVYLTVDCVRPILDALGLDEHHDVGRFLVAFDALLAEAGITEALVVHHMGHTGERSRGDSRLRDWPDVEWRLVRQDEDAASPRYISAYGRDVDVPESQLLYDPATRHLRIAGGSRRDAVARELLPEVLAAIDGAALSMRAIEQALVEAGQARDQIRAAVKYGVRTGAISTEPGPRRAILHRRVPECAGVRGECAAHTASECAAAYIEPRTRALDLDASVRGDTEEDADAAVKV